MGGTYALDWSPTVVGKDVVYPDGCVLRLDDKPAAATAALQFPEHASNSTTRVVTLPLTIDAGGGTVTFQRKTSTEAGADKLIFLIDGVEKGNWSGVTAWGEVSFPITAGARTLEWRFSKDGSAASGLDSVFIALLSVTNVVGPPPLTVNPNTPLVHTFDDGALPAAVTSASWATSILEPITGARSLRSPVVTAGLGSYVADIALDLPENGVVSFKWKVSSEVADKLKLAVINGGTTRQLIPYDVNPNNGARAGVGGTASGTVYLVAAPGAKTLRATYTKDANVNQGSDAAWLDDLSIPYVVPPPPPAPTGLVATPTEDGAELEWVAAAGATGYDLRLDAGAPTALGNVLTTTITGLDAPSTHDAEVRATNAGGASAWVSVEFTTIDPNAMPDVSARTLRIYNRLPEAYLTADAPGV